MVLRIQALAAVLVLASCACAAQERTVDASCPIEVAVAGTDVPWGNSEAVVLWFSNRSSKPVSQVQFDVTFVSSTNQLPSSGKYVFDTRVLPGRVGLVVRPAADEAAHVGSAWREIRGLEAQPARVLFSDGTQWQPSGSSCKHLFLNQNYIQSMRRWNRELRTEWNHAHPEDPIPSNAMAALLEPH